MNIHFQLGVNQNTNTTLLSGNRPVSSFITIHFFPHISSSISLKLRKQINFCDNLLVHLKKKKITVFKVTGHQGKNEQNSRL